MDEPCFICGDMGDVISCKAGCGLHVHTACIGEELLFPSTVGLLCGSCFVTQQNRASKENLQQGGPTGLSVRRAVLFLNLETNSPSNFDKFGHMASLRLLEIGEIAGYPIKPFAAKFVEPYLQRWIREKLVHASKSALTVREVFTFLVGLYGLKQACIAHGLKEQLVERVKARKYSATDFLGWHPGIESPHVACSSLCPICSIRNPPELKVCARCSRPLSFPSVFTKFTSALLATYYAEQVGIPLGTTSLDVFAHTKTVRASYKGLRPYTADGVDWEPFADQLRAIFGLLDVSSNFGVLQLNAELFGPELAVLLNASHLNHAMLAMEFEVVAKFLQSLRLFGAAKSAEWHNLLAVCEHFLLVKQQANGSWCKLHGGTAAEQYKATATCAKALVQPMLQGFGPVSSDCLRLLEKWAKTAPNATAPDTPNLKVLASGAQVLPSTRTSLKQLETLYRRQLVPESGANVLERLVAERLRQIVPSKQHESENDNDDDAASVKSDGDALAGTTDSEHDMKVPKQPRLGNADSAPSRESEDAASGDDSAAATDARVGDNDDDALTSMSLNEDLEIFDGLKFEGGDVIDVASTRQQQPQHELATADDEDGDNEGDGDATDGADNDNDGAGNDSPEIVRPDDDDDDDEMPDMYDDDDDENETHGEMQVDEGSSELPDALPSAEALDDAPSSDLMPPLSESMAFADTSSGDFSLDT